MSYNLTSAQQEVARRLVAALDAKQLTETFDIFTRPEGGLLLRSRSGHTLSLSGDREQYDALEAAGLLHQRIQTAERNGRLIEEYRSCTATASLYRAVKAGFAEAADIDSSIHVAESTPTEIAPSLARLRRKFPDPLTTGFLIMRFTAAKPFAKIVEVIKATAEKHGIAVVRADENEFHGDLWGNVRTHLHGCGFGIAVYERIESNEPNANVGLEVGYLMAMNKPVLLLKDKTLPALQADLAGKLYKHFDPHDPEGTIPQQMEKWLEDNGLVVPNRSKQ